jgi:two-component system LytT family response regulator
VDDEPIARRGIKQLLKRHADMQVAGEARNGPEAVRLLNALNPDLVFLDVQMPEMDGFAVLRELTLNPLPAIVFVTAHDSFAVRAFEAHALDYLVKPVHEDRFEDSVTRVRERLRSREAAELSRRLSSLLAEGQGGTLAGIVEPSRASAEAVRSVVVAIGGSDLLVDVCDIEWIEADDYYAAIHVKGRRHLVRESLASLEGRLDRSRFVRAHRSAIVNLAFVREMRSHSSGDTSETSLVLRDGTLVPLSRRRREEVTEAVRRFAGGR